MGTLRAGDDASLRAGDEASLRAGMAEVVITPPVGVRLAGYADRTKPSTGVLDELYCKALVLDDGSSKIALVVCDLLGVSRSVAGAIRSAVQVRCGIPAARVMVTAIHTHSGPDMDLLDEAAIDHLVAQAAGAVSAALAGLRGAVIGFGTSECTAGVSRRNPRSPRVGYHLYSYPEGAMDTRVLVLSVQDAEGAPLGAVVNYACHPVTLGWEELAMSKDWVEYMCRVLKTAWGPRAVPLFLQGCAADINPRWTWDHPEADPLLPPDWPQPMDGNLEARLVETRRLGNMVGGAALAAASSVMRPTGTAVLDGRLVEVRLPVRPDLPAGMRDADFESRPAGKYPGLKQRLAASPKEIVTDVQVLKVGDAWIVGLPGEVMIEYQVELRKTVASPYVFVSELAGDSIWYIPTPASYKEGGYEPNASFVGPSAGGQLLDAARSAIRAMGG
jgi:neutral ceramidase